MSLLIKALQKSEPNKPGARAIAAGADVSLELQPKPDERLADGGLAEANNFSTQSNPMASANGKNTMAPTSAAAHEAAANLLRTPAETTVDFGGRRAFWLGLYGLTAVLLSGIGFYIYLQSLQPAEILVPRQPPTAVASAAPDTTAAAAPVPAEALDDSPQPTPAAPVEIPSAEPAAASTPAAAPAPDSKPAVSKPETEDAAVKVTRNRQVEPAINATAMAAYQAFSAGDDAAAARLYRQLLQAEPRNVDALLGLAAVSARHENSDDATHYYLRALELEPQNSVAQAGVITLLGQADPVAAESRLKTLLAQQPEAAYLHAALGGIYAGQGLWPHAQQAYFQAFRLDAANAEHAFNLAVSMDQLGKPELALDYYHRARALLPRQGGAVDRHQLDTRIAQLRSATGK